MIHELEFKNYEEFELFCDEWEVECCSRKKYDKLAGKSIRLPALFPETIKDDFEGIGSDKGYEEVLEYLTKKKIVKEKED